MSFFLSKLFRFIFLSPNIFIFIGIFILYFTIKDRKGLSIFFIIVLILSLYFLSIEPGRDMILKPLEDKYPPINISNLKEKIDAIVVLCGGIVEGQPVLLENEKSYPGPFTTYRLLYGYFAWKELMVPIIVSGGRPFMSLPEAGADVMRSFLLKLGVPDAFIILERRSRNTWENAQFTLKICDENGFKNILLVTSSFHMPRAVLAFSKGNVNVYPAPASYITEKHPYNWTSFLPHSKYLFDSFLGLKERVGILFYKIFTR